ncbi:MAG TPA: hypothetical protein VMT12_09220 [Syntrophales bacterium]|nr:hypothetical protein [Syntrophales bacterium]
MLFLEWKAPAQEFVAEMMRTPRSMDLAASQSLKDPFLKYMEQLDLDSMGTFTISHAL